MNNEFYGQGHYIGYLSTYNIEYNGEWKSGYKEGTGKLL